MDERYSSLPITNDFMFGKIMQDEKLCKPFLEQILGISIRKIEYLEPQKSINLKADARSIRMDIYVEDDAGSIYDCEMQTTQQKDLPLRMRYYQGHIDMNLINKGGLYSELKNSYVIFICTYDLFGHQQYIYTFENRCKEISGLTLRDNEQKIVVCTNGMNGTVSDEFKKLMNYLDSSLLNETNNTVLTENLNNALLKGRSNEEWRHDFMTLELLKKECEQKGREAGRKEGREEGRERTLLDSIQRMTAAGVEVKKIKEFLNITDEEYAVLIKKTGSNI